MFEWSNTYSVGVRSIDAQHQNLFVLAQELYTAMSAGKGKATTGKVLDRLIQYTQVHFAFEERLLQEHGYPDLCEHRSKHAALTQQVLQFQKDYSTGRATLTVQLLTFLKDWLTHHICESDIQYAPFVK